MNKALTVLQNQKYEISTLQQFTKTYIFIKEVKKFIESVEAEAKKKGFDLMCEEDAPFIELDGYTITKQESSESKKYRARRVIEGLGVERAIPFLKVDKAKLDFYLKKGFKDGVLTAEELEKCQEKMDVSMRKGFIKLTVKK